MTDEQRQAIQQSYLDGDAAEEIALKAGADLAAAETYLRWWCDRGCPDDGWSRIF